MTQGFQSTLLPIFEVGKERIEPCREGPTGGRSAIELYRVICYSIMKTGVVKQLQTRNCSGGTSLQSELKLMP